MLGGKGSRDRDGDLELTSETDWLSVTPYHFAPKSRQCFSAGFHAALDLAFHSQFLGSTKMGKGQDLDRCDWACLPAFLSDSVKFPASRCMIFEDCCISGRSDWLKQRLSIAAGSDMPERVWQIADVVLYMFLRWLRPCFKMIFRVYTRAI